MLKTFERGRVTACMLAALMATGCGGGDAGGGAGDAAGGDASAPVQNPVDPATAGSLSGTVTFSGTPQAAMTIDMTEEQVCAEKHDGEPMTESAMVGDDGGLGNVFVYVKSGPVDNMEFPTSTDAVVLDQDGCRYHPHVLGLMAGQDLTVRNSDAVLHNVNATPSENRPFNRSQPQAGMEFTTSFATPEVMVPVRCDVHGWMEAYIGVTGHGYHAVTTTDGAFSLDNLPPGEYEIEAWHEVYGAQTQMVTIDASGSAEVTFEFNDQMAAAPMGPALIIDHETGTLRRAEVADSK